MCIFLNLFIYLVSFFKCENTDYYWVSSSFHTHKIYLFYARLLNSSRRLSFSVIWQIFSFLFYLAEEDRKRCVCVHASKRFLILYRNGARSAYQSLSYHDLRKHPCVHICVYLFLQEFYSHKITNNLYKKNMLNYILSSYFP